MPRGSKPGERRGGRKAGTPNHATAEIKALAQAQAPKMIKELVRLALHAESDAARVAAANAVLDRGYGKPKQEIDLEANVNHSSDDAFHELVKTLELAAGAKSRGDSGSSEVGEAGEAKPAIH